MHFEQGKIREGVNELYRQIVAAIEYEKSRITQRLNTSELIRLNARVETLEEIRTTISRSRPLYFKDDDNE